MDKFPQYLHMPYRILFLEKDELALIAFGYLVGVFISWKPLLLWPLLIFFYRKEKRQRARGFLLHIGYWIGLINLKKLPPSYLRKFEE